MATTLPLAAGLLAALAGACGPNDPPIVTCEAAANDVLATIELGAPGDDDGPFVPLGDGDSAMYRYGGQGGTMLAFRLRVTVAAGAALPECVLPTTRATVAGSGEELFASQQPLALHVGPGPTEGVTDTYLNQIYASIPPAGTAITVTVTAGPATATRMLLAQP